MNAEDTKISSGGIREKHAVCKKVDKFRILLALRGYRCIDAQLLPGKLARLRTILRVREPIVGDRLVLRVGSVDGFHGLWLFPLLPRSSCPLLILEWCVRRVTIRAVTN
ncbi:uncharacterized protein LOC119556701 [Drosophila subpulchrella]|uniref:uncharacterized protein LOC119556701 n=1 Tax=Drosophila subpulchrella TaxID=1486046 RepID=UPI0018A18612|nr:uncharacterized protein LOC119556701 [Drosophila subpulchrella]XP_037725026.1 uncharacterized protein LOC119556701 [Drosophila subpulchrella]